MTVSLRPHHLLCTLTYVGEGYDRAFVANYDALVVRLQAGEDILIVDGPDDICRPLLAGPDQHCRTGSVIQRDGEAEQALAALLSRPVGAGQRLTPTRELLARMREAFRIGQTRSACAGCEWADLCTSVARDGFNRARL